MKIWLPFVYFMALTSYKIAHKPVWYLNNNVTEAFVEDNKYTSTKGKCIIGLLFIGE